MADETETIIFRLLFQSENQVTQGTQAAAAAITEAGIAMQAATEKAATTDKTFAALSQTARGDLAKSLGELSLAMSKNGTDLDALVGKTQAYQAEVIRLAEAQRAARTAMASSVTATSATPAVAADAYGTLKASALKEQSDALAQLNLAELQGAQDTATLREAYAAATITAQRFVDVERETEAAITATLAVRRTEIATVQQQSQAALELSAVQTRATTALTDIRAQMVQQILATGEAEQTLIDRGRAEVQTLTAVADANKAVAVALGEAEAETRRATATASEYEKAWATASAGLKAATDEIAISISRGIAPTEEATAAAIAYRAELDRLEVAQAKAAELANGTTESMLREARAQEALGMATRIGADGLNGWNAGLLLSKGNLEMMGVALGVVALRDFATFQTTVQQVAGNTGMLGGQVGWLTDQLLQLGQSHPQSLDDIAQAMRHASDEGYRMGDGLTVVKAALEGATATGAKGADVANSLATAMQNFHEPASNAARDMNMMLIASQQGNVTLEQIVTNMSKLAPLASAIHMPLVDALALEGAMTRATGSASQAQTFATNIITHMIAPTKAALSIMADLHKATGIDLVADFQKFSQGTMSYADAMNAAFKATDGNVGVLFKMFGGVRGGIGDLEQRNGGLREYLKIAADATSNTSQLDAQNKAAMQTLSAEIGIVRNLGVEFLASFGGDLAPVLKEVGNDFGPIIGGVASLIESNGPLVSGIGEAAVKYGEFYLALQGLKKTEEIILGLRGIGTAIGFIGTSAVTTEAELVALKDAELTAAAAGVAEGAGGVAAGAGEAAAGGGLLARLARFLPGVGAAGEASVLTAPEIALPVAAAVVGGYAVSQQAGAGVDAWKQQGESVKALEAELVNGKITVEQFNGSVSKILANYQLILQSERERIPNLIKQRDTIREQADALDRYGKTLTSLGGLDVHGILMTGPRAPTAAEVSQTHIDPAAAQKEYQDLTKSYNAALYTEAADQVHHHTAALKDDAALVEKLGGQIKEWDKWLQQSGDSLAQLKKSSDPMATAQEALSKATIRAEQDVEKYGTILPEHQKQIKDDSAEISKMQKAVAALTAPTDAMSVAQRSLQTATTAAYNDIAKYGTILPEHQREIKQDAAEIAKMQKAVADLTASINPLAAAQTAQSAAVLQAQKDYASLGYVLPQHAAAVVRTTDAVTNFGTVISNITANADWQKYGRSQQSTQNSIDALSNRSAAIGANPNISPDDKAVQQAQLQVQIDTRQILLDTKKLAEDTHKHASKAVLAADHEKIRQDTAKLGVDQTGVDSTIAQRTLDASNAHYAHIEALHEAQIAQLQHQSNMIALNTSMTTEQKAVAQASLAVQIDQQQTLVDIAKLQAVQHDPHHTQAQVDAATGAVMQDKNKTEEDNAALKNARALDEATKATQAWTTAINAHTTKATEALDALAIAIANHDTPAHIAKLAQAAADAQKPVNDDATAHQKAANAVNALLNPVFKLTGVFKELASGGGSLPQTLRNLDPSQHPVGSSHLGIPSVTFGDVTPKVPVYSAIEPADPTWTNVTQAYVGAKPTDPGATYTAILDLYHKGAAQIDEVTRAYNDNKAAVDATTAADQKFYMNSGQYGLALQSRQTTDGQTQTDAVAKLTLAYHDHTEVTQSDIDAGRAAVAATKAWTQAQWDAAYQTADAATQSQMRAQYVSGMVSQQSTIQGAQSSVDSAQLGVIAAEGAIAAANLQEIATEIGDQTAIQQAQTAVGTAQFQQQLAAITDMTAVMQAAGAARLDTFNITQQIATDQKAGDAAKVALDAQLLAATQKADSDAIRIAQMTMQMDGAVGAAQIKVAQDQEKAAEDKLAVDQANARAAQKVAEDQLRVAQDAVQIALDQQKIMYDTLTVMSDLDSGLVGVNDYGQQVKDDLGSLTRDQQQSSVDQKQLAQDTVASGVTQATGAITLANDQQAIGVDQDAATRLQQYYELQIAEAKAQQANDQMLVQSIQAQISALNSNTAAVNSNTSAQDITALESVISALQTVVRNMRLPGSATMRGNSASAQYRSITGQVRSTVS